jgi:hypothetical protein
VSVPVMHVGEMRMAVDQRRVLVFVRVGFIAVPRKGVHMLMVGIMRVAVSMCQRFMRMLVLVPLRQVQGTTPASARQVSR